MSYVLRADIEEGGRLVLQTVDGSQQAVPISLATAVESLNLFNWSVTVGLISQFKIKNYHFSDHYFVKTQNGKVWIIDDIIYYQPNVSGEGGFTINGTYYRVYVLDVAPAKPSIVYPEDNSENIPTQAEFVASQFISEDPALRHIRSRWQIAKDPDFVDIILDREGGDILNMLQAYRLQYGQELYVRVQHVGEKNMVV